MKEHATALQDIDKPHFRYWHALYLSFYSNKLYVDVGKRWKVWGIWYLMLLFVLITIPFSLRVIFNFDQFFKEQILLPIQKLPPVIVQNGEVFFDKPMPYLIRNDANEVIAIIDTTGSITHLDNTYPKASILITKNKLYYRLASFSYLFLNQTIHDNDPSTVSVQTFDKNMNQVFNGEEWVKSGGVMQLRTFLQFLIYPIIVLLLFNIFLILYFILAFMGQFISQLFFRQPLTFKQAFRLLAIAGTPMAVFLIIGLTFNWIFSGIGLVLMTLLAVYFCFGVISLRNDSKKVVLR